MNFEVDNIATYCEWSKITHLFVTCLAVRYGKVVINDIHDNSLASASTYMNMITGLKRTYPNLRIVLVFDHVYLSSVQKAIDINSTAFFTSLSQQVIKYSADGIELDFNILTEYNRDSSRIALVLCESGIRGKLFLTIGGNVDLNSIYNCNILNLFGALCAYVIVNSFGFFQYDHLFLKHGKIKLMKAASECDHFDTVWAIEKVIKIVPASKVLLGLASEGVVFTKNGKYVTNVYETSFKDIRVYERQNIESDIGMYISYDNLQSRLKKFTYIDQYGLKGVVCGDIWHDTPPKSADCLLNIALDL